MPINFNSLNTLQDTARVTLNNDCDFQKASFFSRQKTIDQNKQNIVNTLKQTIASDPKYFGVQNHLEGMIDGLLTSKLTKRGITAGQIKDILAYAESLSTPAEQKKSFMAGAMHTAFVMHQNQNSSAKFGLPTSLEDSSNKIKDSYSNAFHDMLKNTFDTAPDLRNVNMENKIREFDENSALIKSTFNELDLPGDFEDTFFANTVGKNYSKEQLETTGAYDKEINSNSQLDESQKNILHEVAATKTGPLSREQLDSVMGMPSDLKNAFLTNTAGKNYSKEDIDTLIGYYKEITDNPKLDASQKKMLYEIVAAKGAPLDRAGFNTAVLAKENNFLFNETSSADKFTAHLQTELSAMGFEQKDVDFIQKQITKAVGNTDVYNLVFKNIKATPEMIEGFADNRLAEFRAAVQEIKDYAGGDAKLQKIGMRTIADLGEVPKAGYLKALHEASGSEKINPAFIKELANNISVDRFDSVLTSFAAAINASSKEIKEDLLPELGSMKPNLVNHMVGECLNSLSADERHNLFDRLSTPQMANLLAMYNEDSLNGDSVFIGQTLAFMRDQIGYMDNLEITPLPQKDCDYTLLPCSIRDKRSLGHVISGNLPKNLAEGMTTENYKNRLEGTFQSMLQINFLSEMQKMMGLATGETTFDKDIVRGLDITMPDGKKLEAKIPDYINAAELKPEQVRAAQIQGAKDQLASYISHGQTDKFAELTPAQTRTAQILMACLSQETEKIINMGGPLAFNSKEDMQAFMTMENREANQGLPGGGRTFRLVEDGSGGFEIQYECTRAINYFGGIGFDPITNLSSESKEHYELNIHIPGAEIERMQTVDFSGVTNLPKSPKISDLMNWQTNFDYGACNMQNVTITGGFWVNGIAK